MIDINLIKAHKNNRNIYVTEHCDIKMHIRNITNTDIYSAIDNGRIIKQYEDDKPFPSCLISGYSGKRPIHIVVGTDGETSYLITAYEPDADIWNEDFTKKKGS